MRIADTRYFLAPLLFAGALFANDHVRLPNLPALGKQAPQLTSYAGKPLVLVFWAVWCGPCAVELREIERISRMGKITVVGVAVESPEKQATRMVERTGVSFANYLDANSAFADAIQISGVPSLLVIDGKGNVVWSQSGYSVFPEHDLKEQIKKIIDRKKE